MGNYVFIREKRDEKKKELEGEKEGKRHAWQTEMDSWRHKETDTAYPAY